MNIFVLSITATEWERHTHKKTNRTIKKSPLHVLNNLGGASRRIELTGSWDGCYAEIWCFYPNTHSYPVSCPTMEGGQSVQVIYTGGVVHAEVHILSFLTFSQNLSLFSTDHLTYFSHFNILSRGSLQKLQPRVYGKYFKFNLVLN